MKAKRATVRAVIAMIAAGREDRVRLGGAALRRAATAVGRAGIGLREIAPGARNPAAQGRGMAAPRIGATIPAG